MKNTYVLFLRGINVGGKTVKMANLKQVLESCKASNVKTVIQSGNAIFTLDTDLNKFIDKLQLAYTKHFGFKMEYVIRTGAQIQELVELNPFKHVTVTKDTRLLVGLCGDGQLQINQTGENFVVQKVWNNNIIWHFTKSGVGPPKFYAKPILQKDIFVTQRSWKLILKINEELKKYAN